jgi:hypothetical protein
MKRKSNQRGSVLLLELLVTMLVLEVLFCIAAPNALQLQRSLQAQQAKSQVYRVRDIQSSLAICATQTTPPAGCASLPALLPAVGTMQMSGFIFTYTTNGTLWTYSAIPVTQSPFSYFVSQDTVVRCSTVSGSQAGETSQPCP